MPLNVFLSATKEDLKDDCRPHAIKAIAECQCVPITMESWDADYEDPTVVCRRKIEHESSHYVGIFAYRRGWAPAKLGGRSITQAEFDFASSSRRPMAVFLPEPGTEFDLELKKRAENQTQVDQELQKAFLKSIIDGGTYQTFEDLPALRSRVTRKVLLWQWGGLRDLAGKEHLEFQKPSPRRKNVVHLGRVRHVRQFQDAINDPSSQGVVCFLIHGPSGFGHRELIERLREEIAQSSIPQPKYYLTAIGAAWRQNGLTRLLEVAGGAVEPGWAPASAQEFAHRIKGLLGTSDIILDIRDVQRFSGSLPGFLTDFWRPVAGILSEQTSHRFVAFLAVEKRIPTEWKSILYHPSVQPHEQFDPLKSVKLPELVKFTDTELIVWLRGYYPLNETRDLAATLMSETSGAPEILYSKLRN